MYLGYSCQEDCSRSFYCLDSFPYVRRHEGARNGTLGHPAKLRVFGVTRQMEISLERTWRSIWKLCGSVERKQWESESRVVTCKSPIPLYILLQVAIDLYIYNLLLNLCLCDIWNQPREFLRPFPWAYIASSVWNPQSLQGKDGLSVLLC